MFARIATFHGSPNRVHEGNQVIDEITPEMQGLPGFQYGYLMVDDKSGKALAVTLWDREEQAKQGPDISVRERVRQALGAKDAPTFETYEVGSEITGGMSDRFARISQYHGSPAKIEDGIRTAKNTESGLKSMPGFQHAYLFVDRTSGKAVSITFWDSEDALTRTSSGAHPLRRNIATSLGATDEPIVESFEVVGRIPQQVRRAA